jgi:hypothetical protein
MERISSIVGFVCRPSEISDDILRTFDLPVLLVHTKFDESNGSALLNSGKSSQLGHGNAHATDSLLPNVHRKTPLANVLSCDEIFVVRKIRLAVLPIEFVLSI